MFQNLNVFQLAHGMASHAGQRQAVVAQNVANADTPGYKARDIVSFHDTVAQAGSNGSGITLRATRGSHLDASAALTGDWTEFTPEGRSDPNGNSVSVEQEILKSVETARQHERAISIYRSAVSILRTSLGRV